MSERQRHLARRGPQCVQARSRRETTAYVLRLVCGVFFVVACREHGARDRSQVGGGSAVTAEATEHSKVELSVDGARVRDVTVDAPVGLATLVPGAATWFGVLATATDGRYLEVDSPATTYPGGEIRLSSEGGRVTVAVYRAPATGVSPEVAALAAQPVNRLTGVTQIDVWTHAPPTQATELLSIEVEGRPARGLDDEDLDRLTEVKEQRVRGWYLRDVLALASVGSAGASITSVHVVGETEADISADQLAALTVLKKNQRGQYVVQRWTKGQDRADEQIRGVVKLIVHTR